MEYKRDSKVSKKRKRDSARRLIVNKKIISKLIVYHGFNSLNCNNNYNYRDYYNIF